MEEGVQLPWPGLSGLGQTCACQLWRKEVQFSLHGLTPQCMDSLGEARFQGGNCNFHGLAPHGIFCPEKTSPRIGGHSFPRLAPNRLSCSVEASPGLWGTVSQTSSSRTLLFKRGQTLKRGHNLPDLAEPGEALHRRGVTYFPDL